MARGGQTHKARNIFKQAFAALESIKGSLYEPEALCNLSQALALVGQTNKATNLVNLALTVVEALEHKGWQSLYLSKISQTLVQLGEKDRITEIAIKVLESVQDKDWNNYFQVGVLTEVGWRKEAMIRAAISLAFVGKTDILNKSLILAEEIEDEECKTDLLTGIAIGFAQNINPQLDSIFKAIKLLKQEWHTEEILSQINEVLVQGRKKEELNQLFAVTQGIKSGRVKVKMFAKVAKALACIEDYETALLALKNALIPEYLVDRQEVFSLLKEGASVIAFIDRGQTLWKLYESITEVEEWWKPKDL
jgi:tetratricopeptide (TPR) repeat protein